MRWKFVVGYLRRSVLILALVLFGSYYYLLRRSDSKLENYVKPAHPLENDCKYPVLFPEDLNLLPYINHSRRLECPRSQEEFVRLNDFVLTVDQPLAELILGQSLDCYYRPVAGGILPKPREIIPLRDWSQIGAQNSTFIYDDIIEVRCYLADHSDVEQLLNMKPKLGNDSELIFHYAFAQIGLPVQAANVEDFTGTRQPSFKYGLDVLVLDSTSLNMFKRHAPSSWKYMKEELGFLHFDGYTKVADNSLVNLIPLMAGLRYPDMGDGMQSDLPTDKPLDSDQVPLLWRKFKASNCATMFIDDLGPHILGVWNYPAKVSVGFTTKPTDHFYRPWQLYQRLRNIPGSGRFCSGSRPYFHDFIRLTEQMIERYRDQCHFSFNFLTDLTHDDTNNLKLLDAYLKETLKRLYTRGDLENTILVIMGDHGNRVNLIRYSYVGRIEERTPLFSVYFPPSFRRRFPDLIRIMKQNQHRLTTHFDAYQMFNDIRMGIVDRKNAKLSDGTRGISLFRPIPINRTCYDANIPVNHCVCMIRKRIFDDQTDSKLLDKSSKLIQRWTSHRCMDYGEYAIKITNISIITTNQYVQHGVRHLLSDKQAVESVTKKRIEGDIEYLDITYDVWRIDWTDNIRATAVIRLQHNLKLKKLFVNLEPWIMNGPTFCDKESLQRGCACMIDCVLYCM